jgi:hypothetical protein
LKVFLNFNKGLERSKFDKNEGKQESILKNIELLELKFRLDLSEKEAIEKIISDINENSGAFDINDKFHDFSQSWY